MSRVASRPRASFAGDRARRGVALPLVLAVLVCLIAVAIPFSISMRHEQGGVAWRAGDDEARRSVMEVRDLALAHLGATAPERDETPWCDGPGELAFDVAGAARDLAIDNLGPRGRLLSAEVEDQSGRIDLNRANLFLVARVLGLSTTLATTLKPEDRTIRLADGDFLQESGYLWIDGEITYYQRHDGATVQDFARPAMVPGLWEPAQLPTEAREHEAGTEVIDFRAWLVAAWVWKGQPGVESRFESVGHPLAIASLGAGALGPEQRARLEQFGTIWAADGGRDRFGNAQRVLEPIVAGQTRELLIEQGQFVGRGMVARVRNFRGEVDHLFVLRSTRRDNGAALLLEMPVRIGADAGAAQVDFLLPRPVNVNSCSRETLVLLLDGLKMRGATREIDAATAAKLAERIEKARPIDGLRSLVVLLDEMVQKEKSLDGEQASVVLRNAEHSGCFDLEVGSAPFGYTSDGVVEVRAAASLNYELNGRERARAFVREVVASSAAGPSARLFKVQRDFDEPWRISRMARGWTTFPENLQLYGGGIGEADPPSRLLSAMSPRMRYPSEAISESGARLSTGWYELRSTPFDKTWHFDGRRGDIESQHPEGWRLVDGALGFHPDGSDPGVPLTVNFGEERPRPFGVSLWWNPGTNLGSEQTLFDWKCNGGAVNPELSDRVRLRFLAGKLEFEVNDAFLRQSEQDLYTSRIVYDFTDGLPLEGETWYHVTAFCRGNRAGQMSLWVDGKPRGKWSHYTRLSGSFTAGTAQNGRIAVDATRLAEGVAKFPPRGAVRVGNDIVEYSSATGSTFTVTPQPDVHFGGLRPAPSKQQSQTAGNTTTNTHPSTEGVELYGYAARLDSDLPPGSVSLSEALGRWGMAKVADSMGKKPVEVTVTNPGAGSNASTFPIGAGFDSTETTIDVQGLDGGKLDTKTGPLRQGGGYAALVSWYFTSRVDMQNSDTGDQAKITSESWKTASGEWVQGVEVIHYGSFDGSAMKNVRRGHVLKSGELAPTDLFAFDAQASPPTDRTYHFVDKHSWVVRPDPEVFARYVGDVGPTFTILVVPISIAVSGNAKQALLVPEPRAYPQRDRCEMAQIGSPESDGAFDPTEWVRYDAIVQDANGRTNLLRCDPARLAEAENYLCGGGLPGGMSNLIVFNGPLADIEANEGNYNSAGNGPYQTLMDETNRENLLGGDPDNAPGAGHRLAFRGVLDTVDKEQESGADVYPVWRTGRSGPVPGRYDEITIVGVNNERPERHFINYAWSQDSAEDWPNACHCALLATTAATRFPRTPSLGGGGNATTNAAISISQYGDSRNYARILKFPSGELPSLWDRTSDLVVGGLGADGAMVDEVRLFATEDPIQLASLGMHALERDLQVGENGRFSIIDDHLRFPHGRMSDIGASPLDFHEDACVWQIGDEFILGGERNQGKPVVQEIAEDGRIRFSGSDRFFAPGFHVAGSTLQLLPWFVMTRLANGVSTGESRLPLVDPEGFPNKGCVMIDQEVLGYTARLTNEGPQQPLYVPSFLADPDGKSTVSAGEAAFRGRYGTPVMAHAADAVVFFWPWRYPDGYQTRCDIPEMATLEIPIAARRGLFHALTWSEEKGDPLAKLVATVRVQGKGGFAVDPDQDDDLFVFDQPGTREKPNLIDRQGDVLRVRLNVDYLEGALDPVDFTKNSWKRAPIVQILAIEQLSDRVVELHEESR